MKKSILNKEIIKLFKTLKLVYGINKLQFISVSILTIISGIIPLFSIKSMQKLINSIQNNNNSLEIIINALMIYLTINVFSILISNLKSYITNLFRIEVNYVINERVLLKTKNLSLLDYEDENVYNMIRKAQDGNSSRLFNIYMIINDFITQSIALISVSTIILFWNPLILIVIILIPIANTLYTAYIGHKSYLIEMNRVDKRRKISYINYLMTNNIAYKELKSYNAWGYLINIFKNNYKNIINEDKKILKEQVSVTTCLSILDEIVGAIVIYNVVKISIVGTMLMGDIVALINTLSTIQSNITGILRSIIELYRENLYIEELYKLLEYQSKEAKGKIKLEEIAEIEFKNVSYRYKSRTEYSLKNVSFKILKGETLGIIGENGSGKTTIIKLLAGFYDDYEGEIKINGIELKELDKKEYHSKIAVLFQDFNKYEFNLRENIGISKEDFIDDDELIMNIINKVGLVDTVKKLSNGLDSRLGSWFGGTELSGGQWQKIGIARTLLRQSQITILDEPTSALDPLSEYQMFDLVKNEDIGNIKIVISHRLSNVSRLNSRIIMLRHGAIIVDGYHEDIINNNHQYKELYMSETRAV
ncbi:ABC transporter ATP-binding protein [Alkaliphilus transvaalensis]|uniref:ABC transporter ATP-binding protein n=1 Tax=Alkaliphilus transvaalensis TaxID=114628 RepID=UPI00047C87E2|nr:ABC transporter ATP-binding protein [Alkaliphilus transvaalensis]